MTFEHGRGYVLTKEAEYKPMKKKQTYFTFVHPLQLLILDIFVV